MAQLQVTDEVRQHVATPPSHASLAFLMHPTTAPQPARGAPRLIPDSPIITIVDAMAGDLARLRELAPRSDSRATLESYYEKLVAALRDATNSDVWVTTDEAAAIRNTTPQAITYLCRKEKLVARKRGGVWEVHKDSIRADTRGVRS